MPEGDTVAWAAKRIRSVLEGRVPDEIRTPHPRHSLDRWPERLDGREIASIETYGKHLFVAFEGELALHSHLGMTGAWAVYTDERRRGSPARAWIVIRSENHEVVQFNGPILELITAGRRRFDQRFAALGPDVLAAQFESRRFLKLLRRDDPALAIGVALLDQHKVAGIGNIWRAEGCWEAGINPCRAVSSVSDAEALRIIDAVRPRMSRSAELGPRAIAPRVYRRAGRPCPRCGDRIRAGGQGDQNRTAYWCPSCQPPRLAS
ncbi:MAG: Fpg/Nei family DNA glycosylase [Solirubrobacteraceae bacterium]